MRDSLRGTCAWLMPVTLALCHCFCVHAPLFCPVKSTGNLIAGTGLQSAQLTALPCLMSQLRVSEHSLCACWEHLGTYCRHALCV